MSIQRHQLGQGKQHQANGEKKQQLAPTGGHGKQGEATDVMVAELGGGGLQFLCDEGQATLTMQFQFLGTVCQATKVLEQAILLFPR